ncbi:hypothetical protein FRC08_011037 [Ceratobasidium sp. 394]|nr:hypothetical protein FRC08_011037 [Ceratobasidium sp. 394]
MFPSIDQALLNHTVCDYIIYALHPRNMSSPQEHGFESYGTERIPALFHWFRLDVPMTENNALQEAFHVAHLYEIYAPMYNRHPSLYNEDHVDVLHRRIAYPPDVEASNFLDWGKYYTISWNTGHALRNAFTQARIKLGEAVQPIGWTKANPWGIYDFFTPLNKAGFPHIPEPEGVAGDLALTGFFWDESEMRSHVARLQFWAICTATLADIYSAYTYRKGHNMMYAGYTHSSPALVAAHRLYSRIAKYDVQPQSMDYFSDDGFSDASSDAGAQSAPARLQIEATPASEPPASPVSDVFSAASWAGQTPSWAPETPMYSPKSEPAARPAAPAPPESVYDWSVAPASPASGSLADSESESSVHTPATSADGTISSQDSMYPGDVFGVNETANRYNELTQRWLGGVIPWGDDPRYQVDRDHWTYNRMMETLTDITIAQLAGSAAH